MPPILNAQEISKSFGATTLFKDISLVVGDGDRIGLIGPNGAGKSTLLSVLGGEQEPDSGEVSSRKRARVATVLQDSVFKKGITVRGVLEAALVDAKVPEAEHEGRIRETSGRAGFPSLDVEAASLSGGWRKRLAIAEALVQQPDVLLLDEPTNHLDLEGIEWLEETLEAASFACVVISHDRYFLENVVTDIVELNRVYADGLLRVRGTYSRFLEDRENYLEAQSKLQEALRNRVKTEVDWLRRGPKARTTKSKARIDSAQELIGQLADVNSRMRTTSAGIEFSATDRQTKRLVELEDVAFSFGDRTIVRNLSFVVTNGMRVGLVGPNGSGKTTLLRLMTGELTPDAGTVKRANSLRVVYFSQMRELDLSLTLRRALAPDSDSVIYQERVVHVASYAAKFMFNGEQLNQPVSRLSGGERARVLIAQLMLQPSDVLIMDEPTNDLDIATLEILEESLLEYSGALILVTHDRYMLDRISNVVLGLDGTGRAERFGDYQQWEVWKRQGDSKQPIASERNSHPANTSSVTAASGSKKKLSYMEQREFDSIEQKVDEADERLQAAHARVEDPVVAVDAIALTDALAALEFAQTEMDQLYERWAELTEKVS
jgi:ATP-binding cassette subfamily F protein uup